MENYQLVLDYHSESNNNAIILVGANCGRSVPVRIIDQ